MDIDPKVVDQVATSIERISYYVEIIGRSVDGTLDDMKKIGEAADEATKKATKGVEKVKRDVKYTVDLLYKDVNERDLPRLMFGGKKLDRALEEAKEKFKRWGDEVRRQMEARGPFAMGDKALGINAAVGGMKSFVGQLTAGMPFGGLIGFMLMGGLKDEHFRSTAARAVYHLRTLGGAGQEQIGRVQAQMRSLYRTFGDEGLEMVNSAIKSFTDLGVTGAEQVAEAGIAVKGFGSSIRDVSIAVDALTGSAFGTTAKNIGEAMTASGASAKQAADDIMRMTASVRSLGLSYGIYSAGITQANSALRLHNQSLTDTTGLFEKIYGGLRGRGVAKLQAGQMALERLQGATGAISGLPEGLQGLIAQSFAKNKQFGYGGMTDPFALLTRFRLGEEGPGHKDFASTIFKDLRSRAYEMAGPEGDPETRRLRAIGALSRVGGMSEQAAAGIIDSTDDVAKVLQEMKPTDVQSKDLLANLNTTFKTYSDRQNQFEKDMRTAQDTLAQIGGALLGIATNSLTAFYNFVRILPLMLKDAFLLGGADRPEEKAALEGYSRAQLESSQNVIRFQDELPGLFSKLGQTAASSLGRFFGKPGLRQSQFEHALNTLNAVNASPADVKNDPNRIEHWQEEDRRRRKVLEDLNKQRDAIRARQRNMLRRLEDKNKENLPAVENGGTLGFNRVRDAAVQLANAVSGVLREQEGLRRADGSEAMV